MLGGEASWDDVDTALDEHASAIRHFTKEHSVQTNEVQRSWMLVPCFLDVARRAGVDELDVVEIGTSAGLNLLWDRYRYSYARGSWGRADAPIELTGEERGTVPGELLRRELRVGSRVGIDVAPIDLTTDEGARLLKSFVWADQRWRLEQLARAIEALREDPPELVAGDAVVELPKRLAGGSDRLTVVLQTAVFGYIGSEGTKEIYAALDEAASRRPLAYIGTHQPAEGVHSHWALAVRLWPSAREFVAYGDFHGTWLDWIAG